MGGAGVYRIEAVLVHEMEGRTKPWDHLPLSPLRSKGKESNERLEDSYQALATTPVIQPPSLGKTLCWLHLHSLCALPWQFSPHWIIPLLTFLFLVLFGSGCCSGAGNPRWGYQPVQVVVKGLQMADFSLGLHMMKGVRDLCGASFIRLLIPFKRVCLHDLITFQWPLPSPS